MTDRQLITLMATIINERNIAQLQDGESCEFKEALLEAEMNFNEATEWFKQGGPTT